MGKKLGFRISSARRAIRLFRRDRRAVSAIIFALSAVPMVLAAGGAVDFTRYYDAQHAVQTALDASVLAGATADNDDTVATETFTSWNAGSGFDGSVGSPSYTSGTSDDESTYTGTVKVSLNMYFTALAGISSLDFTVTSKAARTVSTSTGSSLCFLVSSTSTSSDTLTLNGGGKINAPDCEVGVVSTHKSTATSGGTVVSSKFCVAGSMLFNTYPANYAASCIPDADPYADADSIPIPTGTQQSVNSTIESTTTMQPGIYTSSVTFQNNAKITFASGTYILKGCTFLFNSGITATGDGVTFYFADSGASMVFNSGSKVTFSAPSTGTYKDILIFDNPSTTTKTSMTIDSTGTLSGVIHLPTRNITFNGSSTVMEDSLIVVNTAMVNSTISVSGGTSSSTSSYSTARLVE